jgi:deoxyribose-phosphate aldolase
MMSDSVLARRLLSLMDLTSLNSTDDAASVSQLCSLACTSAGSVAAVCIWPRFIPVAQKHLSGSHVAIAVVTNFPDGAADVRAAATATAAAIAAGADEVDVVFPYHALLAGDESVGVALVRACRAACGTHGLLKVILETGQLVTPERIAQACDLAIEGGASFLKTSTGKTQPGATLEATATMLDAIAGARSRGINVGLKVAGGVRSVAQAQEYLELYERRFGPDSATPASFRIGASSLITPLLAALR